MLIYTNSENYTNIANAIRELNGKSELLTPAEMADALDALFPDYGVSFDTFDSNGNVLTASTYGYKVSGLSYKPTLTTVKIADEATEIDEYAFEEDENLTSINLHENIEKIGRYAFSNCDKLSISELPKKVTELKNHTFYFTYGIKNFVLHENIKIIENSAFCYSSYLTTVTFKGIPTQIGNNAFESCSRLTTINVPWAEGEIAGAPWGATNATIYYNHIEE